MTVTYQNDLGSVGLLGGFTSLLFKWRGSLYKLCYRELICLLIPFMLLSALYRLAFNEDQKRLFEKLVRYFDKYLNMIPLSFILGFYVTIVAQRWWQQFMALPWPDRLILSVVMYIPGYDAESRLLRKTLVRQCNLMAVLVLRTLSDSVRDRLKTTDDIVKAGFMTPNEKECYEAVKTDVNIYWLPGLWFTHYLQEARRQGRVKDAHGVKLIMEQFLDFRARCATLWGYGWVNIPLVYTQVVTLATYSFFIACIFGRQHIDDDKSSKELPADVYFPSWTVLQFFFYMGLLKVAEQMINPYGDDDEDFELNYLLNRHAEVIDLGTNLLSGKFPSYTNGETNGNEQLESSSQRRKESPNKKTTKRKSSEPQNIDRSPAKESAGMTSQQPEQISSLTSPSNRGLQDTVNVEQTVTSPRLKDDKFHHIVDFVVSSAKIPKVVENYEEKNSASSNQNWKASNNRIKPELPV